MRDFCFKLPCKRTLYVSEGMCPRVWYCSKFFCNPSERKSAYRIPALIGKYSLHTCLKLNLLGIIHASISQLQMACLHSPTWLPCMQFSSLQCTTYHLANQGFRWALSLNLIYWILHPMIWNAKNRSHRQVTKLWGGNELIYIGWKKASIDW